jgi:hypothetical protein
MIETLITELIAALKENTEAHKASQSKAAKPAKVALAVVSEPEPEIESAPEPEPAKPATKVAAPKKKADDTPNVPAPAVLPGQPEAGEHVDVDEVIASIQKIVKTKMMEGDVGNIKEKWTAVRSEYGIERVTELRDEPAKLLEVLAKAKAL